MSEIIVPIPNSSGKFEQFLAANEWFYLVLIVVYLIPFLIALIGNKHNLRSIFLCNLLFGISGVGWLISLIWACLSPENKPPKLIAIECKYCKELLRPKATVCHHCHKDNP